jgi:hypothetical protein
MSTIERGLPTSMIAAAVASLLPLRHRHLDVAASRA